VSWLRTYAFRALPRVIPAVGYEDRIDADAARSQNEIGDEKTNRTEEIMRKLLLAGLAAGAIVVAPMPRTPGINW